MLGWCASQGIFDYLIATDESVGGGAGAEADGADGADADGDDEDRPRKKTSKKKKDAVEKDAEFGVARGVDFKGVATVINVDMPPTQASYTHRIGRTARAGASGRKGNMMALAQALQPQCKACVTVGFC